MKLFYTNSTKHLAKRLKVKKGKFILKKFSDNEIYVKITEDVKNKKVSVLASTNAPGDNILELAFLLDALKREKAKINLLIPYFGYARQDKPKGGEALSAQVVSNIITKFRPHKITIIHMHSPRVNKYLTYENVIPLTLYSSIIKKADVLVAPDKGSIDLVKELTKKYKISSAIIEKRRLSHQKVKVVKLKGDVKGKKALIIDDMISTGVTIIEVSKKLEQSGAIEVSVIATHGIFAGDAVKKIEKSNIKKVYVTNSLCQTKKSHKIKIINISSFIKKLI